MLLLGLVLISVAIAAAGRPHAAMSRLAGGAPPIVTTRDVYNYLKVGCGETVRGGA